MEPEERARIDEIWAILRESQSKGERRQEEAEKRQQEDERRHQQALKRMEESGKLADKRHQQAMKRHRDAEKRLDRAEARMEKYDQRFEATRRLVEGGIKFVTRTDQRRAAELAALAHTVDRLAKTQQAFLDSLRRGGNGNGRRRA